MDKEYIFETFKSLKTVTEKVEFLKQLESYNLPYQINYQNLIKYYTQYFPQPFPLHPPLN